MSRFFICLLPAFLLACPPEGRRSAPSIVSFRATNSALCSPGTVTLTWAQADADKLTIDNGVGDVSSVTKKTVQVTGTTTFTLTASNELGTTTQTTTVVINTFPRLPFVDTSSFPSEGATIANDRLALAYSDAPNGRVFVCQTTNCTKQTLYSNATWIGPLLLGSEAGDFFAFANTNAGGQQQALRVYSGADGAFGAGQPIVGLASGAAPMRFSLDEPSGRAAVVSAEYVTGDVYFSERINASWSGNPVKVAGVQLKDVIVLATGYAANVTPYILYIAQPDVLTLIRRAGTVWTVAASKSINSGAAISRSYGASATVSPDGKTALVLWGVLANLTYAGWLTAVDMATNTIASPASILAPTPVTKTQFSTHAAFSASSEQATYVLGTEDQRAWTGTYSRATSSASAPAPFHPEWLIGPAPVVGYNSCDEPLIVYTEKESINTGFWRGHIDRL